MWVAKKAMCLQDSLLFEGWHFSFPCLQRTDNYIRSYDQREYAVIYSVCAWHDTVSKTNQNDPVDERSTRRI